MLGVGTAGGRRRSIKVLKSRIKAFRKRVPRIQRLRRAGVNAVRLARAAGTPMITYGADVSSMAPSHLEAARRAIAKAVAPAAGGKSSQVVLYVADGASGTLDPAFDANVLPLQMWALAHWQSWVPVQKLEAAMQQALADHPPDQPTAWRRVAGPVSALVAAIRRLGWAIGNHRQFRTDVGEQLDLLLDPPCVVAQAARRAVRRWRVAGLGRAMPALIPQIPDLVVDRDRSGRPTFERQELVLDFADVLDSVLAASGKSGKKAFADWEPNCKGELRSAITGGQWPQARLAAVKGWTDTVACQLCQAATGTLQHRHSCAATLPLGGWPAPGAEAGRMAAKLDANRQPFLQTRGLFTMKVSIPTCPDSDTFTWIVPLPRDYEVEDLQWFVDGSLFDEYKRYMRRTGFGVVAVDRLGSLVACGYGIPPRWIYDAAGAELWAVCFVLGLRSYAVPAIVTDCKGILDSLSWAPQALTCHDKALARTWHMIRLRLDDDLQQLAAQLTWMPSHVAQSSIGVALDSRGRPITATMWRANKLADALAKLAAGRHRLPLWATPAARMGRAEDRTGEATGNLLGGQARCSDPQGKPLPGAGDYCVR